MKRLFALALIVLSLWPFSACGEKATSIEQQIFQIDMSWELAAEHQEQITLKEIEYTNSYYRAKISGVLYYNADSNSNSYEISEQKVDFYQEYGQIWSTIVSVEQLGEITIYAHRLGDGYIANKKCQFDDFIMTVEEYHSYRHINFLFYSNKIYLLFE